MSTEALLSVRPTYSYIIIIIIIRCPYDRSCFLVESERRIRRAAGVSDVHCCSCHATGGEMNDLGVYTSEDDVSTGKYTFCGLQPQPGNGSPSSPIGHGASSPGTPWSPLSPLSPFRPFLPTGP